MLTIIQKPVAPGNFRKGRGDHQIVGIVIHISTGSATGTDAWFANPESRVSAHYLVLRDGTIHKYVDDADTAFHAGIVQAPTWWLAAQHSHSVNEMTIGIEHEGTADKDIAYSQYLSSAELIAMIAERHLIPVDNLHIVPHRAIRANKTCPGKIDVAKLIELAKTEAA